MAFFLGWDFMIPQALRLAFWLFRFFFLCKTLALLVSCDVYGDRSWVHPRLQGTRSPGKDFRKTRARRSWIGQERQKYTIEKKI